MRLRLLALAALFGAGCQILSGVANLDVNQGAGDGGSESGVVDDGGTDALANGSASGNVYYLQDGKTVTLHLNGGPPLTVKGTAMGSAPFAFPDVLKPGATYEVTVDPTSDGACWVKNGKGTFAGSVRDLDVRCVLTATATSTTGGTIGASSPASPLVDFPGTPTVTFKTDRAASDVLLFFYTPAVQSSGAQAKTVFAIDVDGTPLPTVERSQNHYGDEGQPVTVLGLTNLKAGDHTIKARWRAESTAATVLGKSPISLGVMGDVAYHVLDGPQVDYTSVLGALVLDSMATFDGVATTVKTAKLTADAGTTPSFVSAATLGLDGLASVKRSALALFQTPTTRTASTASSGLAAGVFLRLMLDADVVATTELVSIAPDTSPALDREQSIVALVDVAPNTKPTLEVRWGSIGSPEPGALAAGSLGAVYLKPEALTKTAVFGGEVDKCFDQAVPTVVPGLSVKLEPPRAGKALVVFQAAQMFANGGFNRPSEATLVHSTTTDDGGTSESPVLYAYLGNSGGYGQGSTMIALVDVPKGSSTLDVRLRSRVLPNTSACMHMSSGDPASLSSLGVLFIE